jgi:hypothetical protein
MSYYTPYYGSAFTRVSPSPVPVTPLTSRDPVQHEAMLRRMQKLQPQHGQVQPQQVESMDAYGMQEGNQRVIITRQEPSLRDCIKEMPSEDELPKLGMSSDFTQFWKKFEEAAKRHVWPLPLIPELLRYRSSDSIKESLRELQEPASLKEAREFLRSRFFPITDFTTVRAQLLSTKQFLREGVEEWEWRLEKINDGRIDLDNVEGLQMYKEAVLPAYRLESGDTIKEFMASCKDKEKRLRAAFGDQAYPTHRFQESRVQADYVDQLSSYERVLMAQDERKLLERIRPEDMRPIGTKRDRDRVNAIVSQPTLGSARKCDNCGKMGHSMDGCWSLHPELRPKKGKLGHRDSHQGRTQLPKSEFIGQCLPCVIFHPETKAHMWRECPHSCTICGQGTHSTSLCQINHGSGTSEGLDVTEDADS